MSDLSDDDGTNEDDTTRKDYAPTSKPTLTKDYVLSTDVDSDSVIDVGDTLTYSIKLDNDGATTITDNTIADNLSGFVSTGVTCTNGASLGTLPAGESCTLTGTYVVQQADADRGFINNIATSSSKRGSETLNRSATLNVTVPQSPKLKLIKTASGPSDPDSNGVDVGDVVTYTYTATNVGNMTLTNVTVAENSSDFTGAGTLPLPAYSSGGSDQDSDTAKDDLAVGESVVWTADYVLTQADVDAGFLENRATAMGSSPANTDDVSDLSDDDGTNDSDKTKKTFSAPGKLKVVKTASTAGTKLGDTITYTIIVENVGGVQVDSITLTDTLTDADGEELSLATAPAFSGTTKAGEAGPNTANEAPWCLVKHLTPPLT